MSPKRTRDEAPKRRVATTAEDGPLGLSLGELMGRPPQQPGAADTANEALPAPAAPPPQFSRIVLQRTRAGRGGKWVTRVLPTPAPTEAQLEALARELRRALGTGAHTEDGALVVQGDIADRIAEWFRKRGVLRIVR